MEALPGALWVLFEVGGKASMLDKEKAVAKYCYSGGY